MKTFQADWTWMEGEFREDVRVLVDEEGKIRKLAASDSEADVPLEDCALLPGFVNAHSHAFQRGLRGCGEVFPQGAGSFWSWREEMYRLVESLDDEALYRLSLQAFREMLAAGITCVGEFHYLHHDDSCEGYDFDEVVLRAAREAGIRIVLLNVCYRFGGPGKDPLEGGQKRFAVRSPQEYWRQMDRLRSRLSAEQSLGAAAHSIRSVPIGEIAELHQEARRRNLAFHMHVEEQPKEIEQCREEYGRTPLSLLCESLDLGEEFTGVHCTHSREEDLKPFLSAGGRVCLCPLTEANLGDGIASLPLRRGQGGEICLGSDSNARISMSEEARWMEYVQRLSRQRRGVFADSSGSLARPLLEAATLNGARSLRVPAGRIAPGAWADFCVLDLTCESLAGWTPETLLESFLLGAGNAPVHSAWVAGECRWSQENSP